MKSYKPDEKQNKIRAHLHTSDRAFVMAGMSVGKTATCLSVLDDLFTGYNITGALVVAPKNVALLVWPNEVAGFKEFAWLRVASLRTDKGRKAFMDDTAHIYVINYDMLPQYVELAKERIEKHGKLPYQVEIWDESTRAKNPSSKRINKFRRELREHRAQFRWALTGTPMPNSHSDLFAQVRLLDDGQRFGERFDFFRHMYFLQTDYMGYKWELAPGAKERIKNVIRDITISVPGGEWPISVIDIPLSLDATSRTRYDAFEKTKLLEIARDKNIVAPTAAALLTKLLQFTSGSVYDTQDPNKTAHKIGSLKLNELRKLVAKHDTLFVLVNFVHEQDRIREAFPHAVFFQDHETDAARQQVERDWNTGKIKMLVAHPASVGHGLNLQYGGHVMVWLTLGFNQEYYTQANSRLARRGQEKTVLCYRMIVTDTVDEVVAASLERKEADELDMLAMLRQLNQASH